LTFAYNDTFISDMTIETSMRALGDLTRLRIMRLIGAMEFAVGELAHVLGQSQPRVSRHVAILCDAGLAERRREGSWVFVRRSSRVGEATARAVSRLLAAAEEEDDGFARICAQDRHLLAAIRSSREKSAAEYFARHAEEWDRLRALLAPAEAVEAALVSTLGGPLGALLDIGTGTGRIAELLEPAAERVVGLDKSPEMLRVARARLQGLPAGRVELVQGDFAALPFADDSFDTVVFHQVLHFATEPDYALAEAARVCRPGGRIAIADLAAHAREELRRTHAHARLGFGDDQMAAMLERHGFAGETPTTVGGGELAVKVWTARRLPPQMPRIGKARPTPARKAAAR
jgi:SAM-dependent methyltransferase